MFVNEGLEELLESLPLSHNLCSTIYIVISIIALYFKFYTLKITYTQNDSKKKSSEYCT